MARPLDRWKDVLRDSLTQRRETRDLLPEVHRLDAQPHLDAVVGGADHRSRLAHSSTVQHIARSVCSGTSTTTPLGRSTRHAGAASVDSLSNPRRLSLRWARYSELDESPFAAA